MARLPITDSEIIKLYKSGYSQNDIARRYKISVVYTRSVLKSAGYNTRGYRALSPAAMKVIDILVNAGITYVSIEKICDISFHAIREYVRYTKCRSRKANKNLTKSSFKKISEFLETYRQGDSFCFLVENMDLKDCDIISVFQSIQEEDVIKHREGLRFKIDTYRAEGLSDAGITKILNISRSIIRNSKY